MRPDLVINIGFSVGLTTLFCLTSHTSLCHSPPLSSLPDIFINILSTKLRKFIGMYCTEMKRSLKWNKSLKLSIWKHQINSRECLFPGARCVASWLSWPRTSSPPLRPPWNQRRCQKTVMWSSAVSYQVGLFLTSVFIRMPSWSNRNFPKS